MWTLSLDNSEKYDFELTVHILQSIDSCGSYTSRVEWSVGRVSMSSAAALLGVPVANCLQEGGLWLQVCTVTGSIFIILVGANIIIAFDCFLD